MILFTISCFIQMVTCYAGYSDPYSPIYQLCLGLGTLTWWIAQVLCYLTYINRLYYTFNNTKYELRNKTLISLYVLIGLFLLCHLGIGILYVLEHKDDALFTYASAGEW